MNALYSLVFVLALVLIPLVGVGAAHQSTFFGVCVPLTAVIIFLAGFTFKIFTWLKSPVPYRIPTTGGQQQSLDWIKQNKWDNPATGPQTAMRMLLEVLTFRSLFRNTRVDLNKETGTVGYASTKWLWLFSLLFHYGFFMIFIRHFRLFMNPVPLPLSFLEFGDGLMQIGIPTMYMSDVLILVGLLFLLGRRLWDAKVRYISLVTDYFPLFLLIGIALTGIYMRYFVKVDVISVKDITMGLVTFNFTHLPFDKVDISFFIHVFLVSTLMIYFPFSKLMHLGGVLLSPTRNLPNDTRMHHHVNPWNPDIKPHSYESYEKEFGVPMAEAGLPLDNPENAKPAEEG